MLVRYVLALGPPHNEHRFVRMHLVPDHVPVAEGMSQSQPFKQVPANLRPDSEDAVWRIIFQIGMRSSIERVGPPPTVGWLKAVCFR